VPAIPPSIIGPQGPEAVTFRTKQDVVTQFLKEAVLRGDLKPGDRLRQDEIARTLGLSQTPVREALLQLSAQGLVVRDPHRGAHVAKIDLADLEQLYAVRSLLESEAARLGAPRLGPAGVRTLRDLVRRMEEALQDGDLAALRQADEAFHMTLYRASGNDRLAHLIVQMWSSFPRYLLWLLPERPRQAAKEHAAILRAASRGDGEAAARAVSAHLRSALENLTRYLSGQGRHLLKDTDV
jgi:DNA-binding GntR family transcriptional regulator